MAGVGLRAAPGARRSSFIIRAIFLNLPFRRFTAPIKLTVAARSHPLSLSFIGVIHVQLDSTRDAIPRFEFSARRTCSRAFRFRGIADCDAFRVLSLIRAHPRLLRPFPFPPHPRSPLADGLANLACDRDDLISRTVTRMQRGG